MTPLLTHAEFWLTHMTRTTLHAGALAVVVGVLILLLGRRIPAGVRYTLWALVLLRLAMPVLPATRWSPMALLPQASQTQPRDANLPQPSGAPKWEVRLGAIELPRADAPAAAVPVQPRTPHWPIMLAGLWASVAASLMLAAILSYRRLLQRVNCGQCLDDPATLRLIDECAREMGVRAPAIIESGLVDGPAPVGMFRPTIVMPLGLPSQLSSQQWRHVILHELAHLKRYDLWIDWGILVLVCLHWFNPLAWLAAWRFRTEREVLRDTMVLTHGREQEREAYGRTLVDLIETLARPAARTGAVGMLAERSDLRRRLTMILADNRRSFLRTILSGALVIGLTLAAFTRAAEKAPAIPGSVLRVPPSTRPAASGERGAALAKALERRMEELRFDGAPLSEVIDKMRDWGGVNIAVNWKTIEAAGMDKTAPVSIRLRDIKFGKALTTILADVSAGPVKLAYTLDEGVVVISTVADLQKNTEINVYDIRDLLMQPDLAKAGEDQRAAEKSRQDQWARDIMMLVQETVDRESWVDKGGKVGQLKFLSGHLIVTQTSENHQQIQGLLEKLRESKSIQVSVQMQFIRVRPGVLGKLGIDEKTLLEVEKKPAGAGAATRPGKSTRCVVLDEAKLDAITRAVKDEKDSSVTSAPRMAMFNGQQGVVRIGTEQAYVADIRAGKAGEAKWVPVVATAWDGIEAMVLPTVSADRKHVVLVARPRVTRLLSLKSVDAFTPTGEKAAIQLPMLDIHHLDEIVTIPDGGTLLMGLPGVAVQEGKDDVALYVTIRPTIILQRDELPEFPLSKPQIIHRPGNP